MMAKEVVASSSLLYVQLLLHCALHSYLLEGSANSRAREALAQQQPTDLHLKYAVLDSPHSADDIQIFTQYKQPIVSAIGGRKGQSLVRALLARVTIGLRKKETLQ